MKGKFIDRVGARFGRLTVLSRDVNKGQHVCWLCQCDCGNTTIVRGNDLQKNHTSSCGCVSSELRRKRQITHGKNGTRIHTLWWGIKQRCFDKNFKAYKYYGKIGITMSPIWASDINKFENDILSTIGPHPGKGWSLDRIDVHGNYEVGNVRWATAITQANNKRPQISNMSYLRASKKLGISVDQLREAFS